MNGLGARLLRIPSEVLLVSSFMSLILLGTLLLLLPWSAQPGHMTFLDALFTSTSAACVTGLIVVDTGSFFTPFGQAVILMLIQTGGLGILTFSSFFAVLLGKKIPLKERDIVRQTHSSLDPRSFLLLVRRIVLFTFVVEGIGACLLLLAWFHQFPPGELVWQSAFHAVSAFCNAGFSLFPDSLIRYQGDFFVNFIFMALIFLGGIGFLVIYDVERRLLFGQQLSLHSRLALLVSGALILTGTVLFYFLEVENALRGIPFPQQILVALFQSVTPRTAGFNTVDYAILTTPTLVLSLLLMFVGGSPGSTAGGVKTTTLAVFLATGYNRFKGSTSTNFLGRTVPEKVVNECISIILVSIGLLIVFNFTLQLSETGPVPHSEVAVSFLETNFEAVSAFGTVGLSMGITPDLTYWGKIQIILLMFIGRVGPLAVALSIGRRYQKRVQFEYYRENVMVG